MNDDKYAPVTDHSASRRAFIAAAGAAAAATVASAGPGSFPIIDTHTHLYDPTRPQGAPFPKTPNPPPFLPRDYIAAAKPRGITGAIVVEASPWVEDNLWVLMTIEKEPMFVGLIGCLDPTKPDFREYLERYHRNKLFLGIRYGNVWEGHDMVAAIESPTFIDNMKAFAQTGLTFEVANPRFDLTEATVRLTDKVPDLRIVLGHLQALPLPAAPDVMKSYSNNLRELRKRKVYAKISGLARKAGQGAASGTGQPEFDPAVYQPMLDFIWDIFGEDYIVYAGRNKTALEILRAYFTGKGQPAAEKFFWRNSVPAYKWVRRDSAQPQLT
jgi:predicted TIM-barrel fold metal-dependent hydrolase